MKRWIISAIAIVLAAVFLLGFIVPVFAELGVYGETEYEIESEVLFDNEYCSLTLVSIEADDDWRDIFIDVICENKTELELEFWVDCICVNRNLLSSSLNWNAHVAPGQSKFDTIFLAYDELEKSGIERLDEVSFRLRVNDDNNRSEEALCEEQIFFYPTGLSADEIAVEDRTAGENELSVLENDALTYTVTGSEGGGGDFDYYKIFCYIENKTGEPMRFSWADVSINGNEIEISDAPLLPAGMRTNAVMNIYLSQFDKIGLTADEVESICFTLNVFSEGEGGEAAQSVTAEYNP